jgi:hypothetical protein
MFIKLFFLLFSTSGIILPNHGNIYTNTLSFPLLGKQNIEAEFSKYNQIYIRLSGLIDENGTAKYEIVDDKLSVILSENLKQLINKRKTEFNLINYDDCKDIVYIQLYIKPLFYKKKIGLERIN